MRRLFSIVSLLLILGAGHAAAPGDQLVDCGSQLTLVATPLPGYRFVGWSDGATDSLRTVEIYSDTMIVAYFEQRCGIYADLPVVARYDWLLMLHVKQVRAMGYRVEEDMVRWYRVVGEPDDIGDPDAVHDDQYLTTGFYLTIERNFSGTGDYYCVLQGDVGGDVGSALCTGALRSRLVRYTSPEAPGRTLRLLPNLTSRGRPILLTGLDPMVDTDVRIFSVTGQRLAEYRHVRAGELWLSETVGVQGCYEVCVSEQGEMTVLRYIVE